MEYPKDQIAELKNICESVLYSEEGGISYFLLEGLNLPDNCSPQKTDGLFCPVVRDGYNTRLYYSEKIKSPTFDQLNWNVNGVRILERNWFAYSWKINETNLRLIQYVVNHLRAKKV